jgi:predicted  nucleic acid-binding Zn-ribbon protein
MRKRKTHEEFMVQLSQKNHKDIKILGHYVGSLDPIDCMCNVCGHQWSPIANSLLQGQGCPQCAIYSQTTTQEQYELKVKNINSNIQVIGTYVNARIKIAHKCLVDGYVWESLPGDILIGGGCPKCAGHIKRTHSEYVEKVSEIHPTIEVIGKYVNDKTKILHKCFIDEHQWYAAPNNILKGQGCPRCANNQRRSQEEYINKLAVVNPNIKVVGQYVNAVTRIRHKCLKCGMDFVMSPYLTLKGCGCRCDGLSRGERFITEYLRSHEIDFIPQYRFDDCRDIYPLPFDFYIVESNSCIEYDGELHFIVSDRFGGEEKLRTTQEHDKIKTQYCLDNGITLLRITYKDNIEKCLNDFFTQQND